MEGCLEENLSMLSEPFVDYEIYGDDCLEGTIKQPTVYGMNPIW
jgi:hypothetical protein